MGGSVRGYRGYEMKQNVGNLDRTIRLAIALVFIIAGPVLFTNPTWVWLSFGAGLVVAATAFMRFCGLYAVLGLNTKTD